mgnify:FL=1
MAEYLKAFALPLIMQICLGLGSAAIAAVAINARIEERIVYIEQRNQEQDTRLEALRQRSEDLGLQMARLESMRSDLAEVKGDVKSLLRERVGAR